MERALILAALICVGGGVLGVAEARWTIRPKPSTTTMVPVTPASSVWASTVAPASAEAATVASTTSAAGPTVDSVADRTYYHPVEPKTPYVIEQRDIRSSDGSYEYKYVLSNGDTRYERAYWLPVGGRKVLARKGFYSYPMPDGRFLTAFYTADHMGFRQDSLAFSKQQPPLPRSIVVPEHEGPERTTATTTMRKPVPKTTDQVNKHENSKSIHEVVVVAVDTVATTESNESETTTRRNQMPNDVNVDAVTTTTTAGPKTTMVESNSPITTTETVTTTGDAAEQQHQESVEIGM